MKPDTPLGKIGSSVSSGCLGALSSAALKPEQPDLYQARHLFVAPALPCSKRTLPARSPFVNSLLNRLKGHHASLVGCQAVEGTPELITADSSGVVKVLCVSGTPTTSISFKNKYASYFVYINPSRSDPSDTRDRRVIYFRVCLPRNSRTARDLL